MWGREIAAYFEGLEQEAAELIRTLCQYPAPSGQEGARAAFCKEWLEKNVAKGVCIDEAQNVLYPVNCNGNKKIILFAAHTDTVFPDVEPMPFLNDGEYLRSPGVGDDTACLAALLLVARYVAQGNFQSDHGILFAANSCEEGLGNLKGIRKIMEDYGQEIEEVYVFDDTYDHLVCRCVGSERYKITLRTEGGHSFRDFGNRNAIAAAAELITRLYRQEIPQKEGCKTTYNVGTAEGGCSVNTVAQEASLLYEYRSDDPECLCAMREQLQGILAQFQTENRAALTVEAVGERPCANLRDSARLNEMIQMATAISQKHSGLPCRCNSGSTDCNIPMSMGIPAVCMGAYLGDGAHTREERVRIDSLTTGLKIVAETVLHFLH